MGIPLSEQDLKLRKLALHAENMQSHLLHVGFLVLPDLMGVGSVIPLAGSNPEEVKTVLRLHRLANEMSSLLCGRTTHPQRLIPGGFAKLPTMKELTKLRARLKECVSDLQTVAGLVKSLAPKLPDFTRETEFIGLTKPDEYALYDGDLASTDTGKAPVSEYLSYVNEYIVLIMISFHRWRSKLRRFST